MRRVLLKISGEALGGSEGTGIQAEVIRSVAQQVTSVLELGIQVGMVVGGGNIFREYKVQLVVSSVYLEISWGCWLLLLTL